MNSVFIRLFFIFSIPDLTTIVTDIWGDASPPYLVAVRSSASIGVFLGGFICVPFVESPPPEKPRGPNLSTNSTPSTVEPPSAAMNITTLHRDGLSKVESIYIIAMCIIAICSTFMLVVLLMKRKKDSPSEEAQPLLTATSGSSSHHDVTRLNNEIAPKRWPDFVTIFMYCVVVATTMGCTAIFGNYIASFTILYLHKPAEEGAVLVSLYGGCTLLSNALATVAVKVIRPARLATVTCSCTIAAFTLLAIFPKVSAVIWVSTALFGLGNIPTMCLAYVAADRFGYLTNAVAGAFAFSSGVFALISTLVVAMVFKIDPMVFAYFSLACAMLGAAAFAWTTVFNPRQNYTCRAEGSNS